MDKDIERRLAGFSEVWRRVTESKGESVKNSAAMMPGKNKKPRRRFDPK